MTKAKKHNSNEPKINDVLHEIGNFINESQNKVASKGYDQDDILILNESDLATDKPEEANNQSQRLNKPSLNENKGIFKDKHDNSSHDKTSVEELVHAALRPYLVGWLNKNLPAIVKNIVTAEVKKTINKDNNI